jgi:thiol-disulfide isomerase/thioredoxin
MTLRRREAVILAAVGTMAAAAGFLAGPILLQSRTGAAQLRSARFTDLSGKPRSVSDWDGRVLVCNFWATWCPPCIEEIPILAAAREEFAPKGVEIIGIALDSAENVVKFTQRLPVAYPLLVSGLESLDLLRKLGNSAGGLPFTVVLDRAGVVAETKLGAFKQVELRALLARVSAA